MRNEEFPPAPTEYGRVVGIPNSKIPNSEFDAKRHTVHSCCHPERATCHDEARWAKPEASRGIYGE